MSFIINLFIIIIRSDIHAQKYKIFKEPIIPNICQELTVYQALFQPLLQVFKYLNLVTTLWGSTIIMILIL